MDISAAAGKITGIVLKINEYYNKIKSIYNKFAKKINEYIDELEKILKKLAEAGMQALAWVDMQIKKVLKKIADALNAVKKKIDEIIEQIKKWYEKVIKKIKISVIKGVFAKLGVSMTDDAAEAMSDMIPHPDITSLIPDIKIELQLPGLDIASAPNLDFLNNIELKKLPLL